MTPIQPPRIPGCPGPRCSRGARRPRSGSSPSPWRPARRSATDVLVESAPMLVRARPAWRRSPRLLEWMTRDRPTHWHAVGEAVAVTMLVVATQSGVDLGAYLAVPAIDAGVRHGLVDHAQRHPRLGTHRCRSDRRRPAQRLGPADRRDAAVARHRARCRSAGQLAVALHPQPGRPAGALRGCPPAHGPGPPAGELRLPRPRQRRRWPMDLDAAMRERNGLRSHRPSSSSSPTTRSARSTAGRTSSGWPRRSRSPTANARPGAAVVPLRGRHADARLLRARRRAPMDARARRTRPGGGRRVRRPPRHRRPLRRRAHAGDLGGTQPDRPRDARRRGAGDRRARLHRGRDRVDQRPCARPASSPRRCAPRSPGWSRRSASPSSTCATRSPTGAWQPPWPTTPARSATPPACGSTCHWRSPVRPCRPARPRRCCAWRRRPSATSASTLGASNLWVTFDSDGSALSLAIEDDGVGNAEPREHHWGLQTMRERAEGVGARLDVSPRPDGGTVVSLRSPMPADLTQREGPWAPPCYWLTTTS